MSSFSSNIKVSLCKIENANPKLILAQACGLIMFSKRFSFDNVSIFTDNDILAQYYKSILSSAFSVMVNIDQSDGGFKLSIKNSTGLNNLTYAIYNLLENFKNTKRLYSKKTEEAAFLRGVFLSCGSVYDPESSYRLEFSIYQEKFLDILMNLINNIRKPSIEPKMVKRNNLDIAYIKTSDDITDVLTYIGASGAAMEIMQIRMLKDVRNHINRTTNIESANMDKTINAAQIQIRAIETIINKKGINYLSDPLKELALLRIDNPDMSLKSLGESLSNPISRSGVNHRIAKIIEISKSI